MKLEEAIKKRRSVRSYKNKKVSKKLIKGILELANLAPTGASKQNRFFIIIEDKTIKEKICRAACKQKYLLEAPIVIVVVTNTKMLSPKELLEKNKIWGMDFWGAKIKNYKKNRLFNKNWSIWKKIWPIQDADTATTTLLLAATAKGLDSCWIGAFDHEQVAKILKLPKNYKPVALVTLGYRKSPPYPQKRKNIEELLHWNSW